MAAVSMLTTRLTFQLTTPSFLIDLSIIYNNQGDTQKATRFLEKFLRAARALTNLEMSALAI